MENKGLLESQNMDAGGGFALYRLPLETDIHFLHGKVVRAEENTGSGFVIYPFNSLENAFSLLPEVSLILTPEETSKLDLPLFSSEYAAGKAEGMDDYILLVGKILAEIQAGNLEKAVASRSATLNLEENFNAFAYYSRLATAYPEAFVYMFSSPLTGTWIGASPELLLSKKGTAIKTLSLAGTKSMAGNLVEGEFGGKEFREQALVSDYISEILSKYSDQVVMGEPVLKKAGKLVHLATGFSADMNNPSTGWQEIAEALHPTPAVCGMPPLAASQFLLENEGRDRKFYSGFLGPVNADGDADLYVNLRCMELWKDKARLYAGAGIVEGSIPEDEWNETEQKLQTLLRHI